MPRFDVFGNIMEVSRGEAGWEVIHVGSQGKHRAAHDVVIPSSISEPELARYLADFFHEYATPERPDVRRLDSRTRRREL